MFRCACQTALRVNNTFNGSVSRYLASSYKSQLSLEKLYPNSDQNHLANAEFKHTGSELEEPEATFSGYIPLDGIKLQYSKSGGPGGQNVNKVNTKVEVRFNVDEAKWIPENVKEQLKEQQKHRITKHGELLVTSEKTRKQILNQADCLDKLRHMIFQACVEPKQPTEEQVQKLQKSIERARRKTLQEKRHRSLIKQARQSPEF